MMEQVWDALIRFRNYVVTLIGAALLFLPDLLAAPELLAVIPEQYHKWVFLATLLVNLAIRPWPATRAHDPEVQYKRALENASDPYENQ